MGRERETKQGDVHQNEILEQASFSSIEYRVPKSSPIKPCMYFYKLLQPAKHMKLSNGLKLNVPETVLVEIDGTGKETIVMIGTDNDGFVVRQSSKEKWREQVQQEFCADDECSKAVIGVRKISVWGATESNSTIAFTQESFAEIMDKSCKHNMTFALQKYIRCRGNNASIHRIVWKPKAQQTYSYNIANRIPFKDVEERNSPKKKKFDPSESLDEVNFSKSYCASFDYPENLQISKIRGQSITPGVEYAQNIVEYMQEQMVGLKFQELVVDFIRDTTGKWWFLQVKTFRIKNNIHHSPRKVQPNSVVVVFEEVEDDTIVEKPKQSKKETTRPCDKCTLCTLPFREVQSTENDEVLESFDLGKEMLFYEVLSHVVIEVMDSLVRRGIVVKIWENYLRQLRLAQYSFSIKVCPLCYCICKQEKQLRDTSTLIHKFMKTEESQIAGEIHEVVDKAKASEFLSRSLRPGLGGGGEKRELSFAITKGKDVDAECHQFRFIFFFHELQDLPRAMSPEGFRIEYNLGQCHTVISFSGTKLHTTHRWQLFEVRSHYMFASPHFFQDYLKEKKVEIKLLQRNQVIGRAFLSFAQILSETHVNSFWKDGSSDSLLTIKTTAIGVVRLKLTLLLTIDKKSIVSIRELVKQMYFVEEGKVAWPPACYHKAEGFLPKKLVESLLVTEFVNKSPTRARDSTQKQERTVTARVITSTTTKRQKSIDPSLWKTVTVIFQRLMGDSSLASIPVTFFGYILRYSIFVQEDSSAFSDPGHMLLTSEYAIDSLFRNLKSMRGRARLLLLGELLLVLQRNFIIPSVVTLANLEEILSVFWLQDSAEYVLPSVHVLSEHRVMWNRAVRRYEQFRVSLNLSTRCGKGMSSHYRVAHRHLWYCEFYETLESPESCLIDIAELRSLVRTLNIVEDIKTTTHLHEDTAFEVEFLPPQEVVPMYELGKYETMIQTHSYMLFEYTKEVFAHSKPFQQAFSHFDDTGCGHINFKEFCQLAEKSMTFGDRTYNIEEEKVAGFCLRHGITDVFSHDRVCCHCTSTYNGMDDESVSDEELSNTGSISSNSPIVDEFEDSPRVEVDSTERRRSTRASIDFIDINDAELDNILGELRASELAIGGTSSHLSTSRTRTHSLRAQPVKPRKVPLRKKKKKKRVSKLEQSQSMGRLSQVPAVEYIPQQLNRVPSTANALRFEVHNSVSAMSKHLLRDISKSEKRRKRQQNKVKREIRSIKHSLQELLQLR